VLDFPENWANEIAACSRIALRDPEGPMVAALTVSEIWKPDREAEVQAIYGTTSREHPGVEYLLEKTHPFYAGGRVEALCLPEHYDFRSFRLEPHEL